jgi:hypothetical protein
MTGDLRANRWAMFAAAALAAVACAAPCCASPETLRESLFGRAGSEARSAIAPMVGRYVSEDGDAFTLDRSQGRALFKLDNNPEVWALQAHPAPRGDIIYKNDLGEPVLRATKLGGVTLFTEQRPGGSAAALAGDGSPLRLQPMSAQALLERLAQASARASRAAHRLITFDAEATPSSSSLIADAALVASEAVVRMTRRPDAAFLLARFRQVRLAEGRRAGVELSRGALQITVAPALGMAGRPSSERIVMAAEKP